MFYKKIHWCAKLASFHNQILQLNTNKSVKFINVPNIGSLWKETQDRHVSKHITCKYILQPTINRFLSSCKLSCKLSIQVSASFIYWNNSFSSFSSITEQLLTKNKPCKWPLINRNSSTHYCCLYLLDICFSN